MGGFLSGLASLGKGLARGVSQMSGSAQGPQTLAQEDAAMLGGAGAASGAMQPGWRGGLARGAAGLGALSANMMGQPAPSAMPLRRRPMPVKPAVGAPAPGPYSNAAPIPMGGGVDYSLGI